VVTEGRIVQMSEDFARLSVTADLLELKDGLGSVVV
jgi:hypothetical protein